VNESVSVDVLQYAMWLSVSVWRTVRCVVNHLIVELEVVVVDVDVGLATSKTKTPRSAWW